MKLPIEISPNPLLTSTVQIRFTSKVQPDELLGIFYPKFSTVLPAIREGRVPRDVKLQDEQLRYAPDFIMSNKDYSLSFSNNAISFENIGNYKLWGNYYPFICEQLKTVQQLDLIEEVQRVGVRYASLFEGIFSLETVLTALPQLNFNEYKGDIDFFRSEFIATNNPNYLMKVQVLKNAKAKREDKHKVGALIDIDAYCNVKNVKLDDIILQMIDELHLEEKKLFYSLLSSDFLASLNPKY